MQENSTSESVIFELKLNSEQYRSEQKLVRDSLGQLVLGIEKTKQAQKDLDATRKAGKVSDADYAQQSVRLREQLKGQTTDQRELTKVLETSQKVMVSGAGSIDQLRARLSELTVAWNGLSAAERDNSEEGKRLQAEARAVSDELKRQESLIGDNRRNVGAYGTAFKQGLAGIVAELAKVTAAQRDVDAGSEQGLRLQQQRIGFLTAAQKAAAQAGITNFAQAQATIDQYAQALAPAAENLVRLEQAQQQAGQTTGESSQQYQQLGFQVAGAQKQLDDLISAQQAAEQASRAGGAAAQGQAGAVEVAANSLAGLRAQLVALKAQRETLDPTTHEAQELNTEILELDTRIQQAAGKIDEFGERIQKNVRKENFDTVSDAIQGVSGATALATLVLGDNTDAAAAQAKALQLMTIAQSARSIAIGLDSAKDAASIVLKKVRNVFLKEEATLTATAAVSTEAHAAVAGADAAAIEAQAAAAAANAEAQGAGTAATAGNIVATEAQVVATEGATLAQRALNLAMKLNPIGLVIIAITALVGLFFTYRNASEATQKKVKDFAETLLRFGTPIGLVYTGIEKLYQKFALVRTVLDPLIKGFNAMAGAVGSGLRSLGEYVGLLDTAAQKASKLAAAELERAQALREQADAEARTAELVGATATQVTQAKLQNIDLVIAKQADANRKAAAIDADQLARIQRLLKAGELLSDADKKRYEEAQKGELALANLLNERLALVNEGIERERTARQQAAQDVQTNAQRAVQNLAIRLEQQEAAEKAQLQRRIARLDLQLGAVQKGTAEELRLQQQKIQAQTSLEIKQINDALVERIRLRATGYAQELRGLKAQEKEALDAAGLTEQQKTELVADYAQKRSEVEQKYSLVAARQAVANIPLLRLQANAAQLKLEEDFHRQEGILALQSQIEQNRVKLAAAKQGSLDRLALETKLIDREEQAAIAALDRRAMSDLEYETKVTAIGQDAVARRKALGEQQTQDVIARLGEEQRGQELNQQKMLAGLTESHQLRIRASKQYHDSLLAAELDNYTAQTLATKAGTIERENVEKQHALNLQAIEEQSSQAQLANIKDKYDRIASVISQSLSAISVFQDAASQDQLNRITAEMNLSTTSQAKKAVLAKQQQRIEAEQHERQKKYAIAQAIIDGGSAVMRILADTPKFDFGIMTAVQIALAAVTTAAQIRTISSQKFAAGTVLSGPSHAAGGIQLFNRHTGQHMGEAEGDEIILTKGVYRSPALRAAASALNVAAGGRAFYTDPTPASMWARYAEGGIVRADSLPQVRTGGVVQLVAPAIDYDLLTDMMADKLGPAFALGAQALPPQNLNLTELEDRQEARRKTKLETDI